MAAAASAAQRPQGFGRSSAPCRRRQLRRRRWCLFRPGDDGARASGRVALQRSTPLTGQVNLLTTSTFDSTDKILSDLSLARGVAYLSLGAGAGSRGDWSARAALTQGDLSSWMLAGSFISRAPTRHRYEAGMTLAAQRYRAPTPRRSRPCRTARVTPAPCTRSTPGPSRGPCRSSTAPATRATATSRMGSSVRVCRSTSSRAHGMRLMMSASRQIRGAGRGRVRAEHRVERVATAAAHVRTAHRHPVHAGADRLVSVRRSSTICRRTRSWPSAPLSSTPTIRLRRCSDSDRRRSRR